MSVGEIQNTPSAADSSNEFARLVEEERIARVLSGEVVASIGHTSMATSEEVSTSETLEPHVALVHYPADKEGNVQTAIEINGHYGSQLDLSEYVDFESDDWRIIFETAKGSEYWCARPAIDNRPGYLVEFGQSRKNDRLEGFYLSKGEKLAPFSFRNKKMTVTATDGIGPVAKVTVLGKEYPADETPEFEEGTLREDFIFLTLWQNLNVWEHKAAYAEWEKQEQARQAALNSTDAAATKPNISVKRVSDNRDGETLGYIVGSHSSRSESMRYVEKSEPALETPEIDSEPAYVYIDESEMTEPGETAFDRELQFEPTSQKTTYDYVTETINRATPYIDLLEKYVQRGISIAKPVIDRYSSKTSKEELRSFITSRIVEPALHLVGLASETLSLQIAKGRDYLRNLFTDNGSEETENIDAVKPDEEEADDEPQKSSKFLSKLRRNRE